MDEIHFAAVGVEPWTNHQLQICCPHKVSQLSPCDIWSSCDLDVFMSLCQDRAV